MSRNLTILEGITASVAEKLHNIGINTIEKLANYSPDELQKDAGVDINIVEKWIATAHQYLENKEKPKIPPDKELTSKYSLKTTTERDMEENKEP